MYSWVLLNELVCFPFIRRDNLEGILLSALWQMYEILYLLFRVQIYTSPRDAGMQIYTSFS
jgi:hypothetical protein